MSGTLYFENFSPGQVFALGPYEVTRDEVIAFAEEFDPQPFHLDEDAAKASILGGLCASGWHTCAMIMRMLCDSFVCRMASLGSNGLDEVKWVKPVYAGETLAGTAAVLETRRSSKNPAVGIFKFRAVLEAGGETKCEMSGIFFVKVRAP